MIYRSLMVLLFMAVVACGGDDRQKTEEPVIDSTGLMEGVSPVTKNSDYYGVGFIIGKPVKVSHRGIIWKTHEVQINVGAFGDGQETAGNNYIGQIEEASIEEDDLADQFAKLDQTQLYVFKYEWPHKLNPEIESTHYHIRSWEPVSQNMNFSHRGVSSYLEKEGGYSSGVRQGKVVQTERWGYWDIDCTVTIKVGGLSRGTENHVEMNTYSEESCAFAEQALKAGVDVEFEYSEDLIEVWDRAKRILHKMTILN